MRSALRSVVAWRLGVVSSDATDATYATTAEKNVKKCATNATNVVDTVATIRKDGNVVAFVALRTLNALR